VALTTAVALGFVVGALVIGRLVVPPLFRLLDGMQAGGTLLVFGSPSPSASPGSRRPPARR
jgi:hypothetical protein